MSAPRFSPEDYLCEEDSQLILEIMNHEAAVKLLNWIRENKIDSIYDSVYQSSYLQLNTKTAPRLMEALQTACAWFGVEPMPPVYVLRDFDDTVTIGGISEPFLLISGRYLSELEKQDPRLLLGVIAAQIAGIRVGHHRGLLLVWMLDTISSLLPIPKPVMMALDALLNDWKRCRVYTCDRAMHLVTGDYSLTLRGILSTVASGELMDRMALGTPADGYRQQVQAFMEGSVLDDFVNLLNSAISDTGWLPLRCQKIAQFAGVKEQEGLNVS